MPSNDMNTQVNADKASITLSLACMIHCLLMPSFLVLTSGFFALSIDNEFIHKAFLIIVLPVSLYALITGYRNHIIVASSHYKNYKACKELDCSCHD